MNIFPTPQKERTYPMESTQSLTSQQLEVEGLRPEPKTYVTDSLPLACFIFANELLQFKEVLGKRPHRMEFVFWDWNDMGHRIAADFWSGGIVSAVKYYDAMRRLRKLMEQGGK
jgi:hypothetical protein